MEKNIKANNYDLTGRVALITGGAGLLGVEHAKALLANGSTVVITDLSKSGLIEAQKKLSKEFEEAKIITHLMDVTKQKDVKRVARQLYQQGLRIDILVNNAAIDPKVKDEDGVAESSRLENFPLEQWNKQIEVGLTGAFLCSQIFGSAMAADGKGGVILNIASDLSVISPDNRLYRKDGLIEGMQPVKPVTYSVVKAGLIGLTRYLSTYWPERGVRANALSPGGIYNGQGDKFVERITSLIPLGRMANNDEYHAAVQFLCSDASAYLNGQNIVMDGGRSVW